MRRLPRGPIALLVGASLLGAACGSSQDADLGTADPAQTESPTPPAASQFLADADELVIGVVLPETGLFSYMYPSMSTGVRLAVADIEAALEHLQREGARLIDSTPRRGGRGAKIAFVHPRDWAGTLIELVELSDD